MMTPALLVSACLIAAGCDLVLSDQEKPVPAFAAVKVAPYAPTGVRFTDRSRHRPTSWLWKFGDGATSRSRNPAHRYTRPGTYTVSLHVTNDAGGATRSRRLRIAARPRVAPGTSFTATPQTGTAPVAVSFRDTSSRFPLRWRWDFGDGTRSTEQNPTHVYRKPGRYDVRLTATNIVGTRARSGTVTAARTDPVVLAAGDIADCSDDQDEKTAALLARLKGTIFALGDVAYPTGSQQDFEECYDPTWGRFKSRTVPVTGNHDYETRAASGYFDYFGKAAGKPGADYRSMDIGAWHVVILNSDCDFVGGCGPGSPQLSWLARDLRANRARCTLAMWHHPRFSSGVNSDNREVSQFWEYLYYAGAELVLNGHDHDYERFAPQDPSGKADDSHGITEIVAGTGGKELRHIGHPDANSLVRDEVTHGVLRVRLRNTSADFRFVPVAGQSFTDSGNVPCHGRPAAPPAPRVGFTSSDHSGDAPLTVAFDDQSQRDPSAWDWDFGDGTHSSSINPLHTYTEPGTYRVRLTVSNATGTDTVTRDRYVVVGPRLPTGDYASLVDAGNPVGYWRLGASTTSAPDATGAEAGRIVGGARPVRDGVTADGSQALGLDGRSGHVEVSSRDDLDVGSDDFSLEAWARPAALGTGRGQAVVQKSDGGDFAGWQYRLALTQDDRWRGTVFVDDDPVTVTAPRSSTTTRWTHLVLERSGDRLLLYVDGELVAGTTVRGTVNDGPGMLAIGRAGNGPVDYFDGAVDEVALYRSALTSAEVSAHYRSAQRR